ncbi:hypothetical protein PORY_002811 [Pneumocystis oryctolagi]|uniref:Uncharacterized protein n=1 Tax=Pneumocystis oryctolagi TaxID=42067 RepID=A0ACB7C8F0_9ASCO|nr:hypothetical protein PORY_002811 [Pneumocystis oryctolagi]
MERTLEDQERHLLVKIIDRILYKLDDLVRPYVHKIVIEFLKKLTRYTDVKIVQRLFHSSRKDRDVY